MRSTSAGRRLLAAVVVALAGLALVVPSAGASPGNPTNAEIAQSQRAVHDKAADVGRITAELVRADADMRAAQARAEVASERYNKARVDEEIAGRASVAAGKKAAAAGLEVAQMLDRLDRLAADNYKNGGALGPLAALITADKPADVIHDATVLSIVGHRQVDTLSDLDRARARQANALSSAQAALLRQAAARRAAEVAKHAAEQARADSQAAVQSMTARKATLETELVAAQQRAGLLVSARKAALARAAARRAAAARAAAAVRAARARAHVPRQHGGILRHHGGSPPQRGGSAATIAVNAALSQLGKPYVWGAAGPNSYDCSGLMLWSYAHAGIYLPHFSGYQYQAGPHVPIGSLIPGDLVFYSSNGSPSGIHHVAMYIGGGSMVEAPTEGIPVHVRDIYYDGLLPLGTRPY